MMIQKHDLISTKDSCVNQHNFKQSWKRHGKSANYVLFFLYRMALFWLQHSRLTMRISQVILHVFMINTVEKILRKNLHKKKKIETCTLKMKRNPKCSHMRFCSKLFCVWDEKRFQKATHILSICEQPNSYQHLFMDYASANSEFFSWWKSLENERNIYHTTLAG